MMSIASIAAQHLAITTPRSHADLIDRLEIFGALYRFGAGQDLGNRALFESAFTPDASLDFRDPARRLGLTLPVFEGRKTIVDAVFARIGGLRTTHTVAHPRVTIDGDGAQLFALLDTRYVDRDDEGRKLRLRNACWVDLNRTDDGWAIRHARIENIAHSGEPTLLSTVVQH